MFLQIYLVDMRHLPHGNYKWILHVVDHWLKLNFAFPLIHKSAADVAAALHKWVFPVMGLPSILQSDNGHKFVNKVIEEVVATWPGQVQPVSGQPRHPQSQGLVEQAHYTLKRMMSAKISDTGAEQPPWADWLPHITCKINLYNDTFTCIECVCFVLLDTQHSSA